ncbi:enolase C-terminal domain-like protein [Deinococcus peraridilitoris]|uniref:Enolase superfamily enzyme related to L-alanine-DL-glutamate epimerase n=1 Tax=Deinococcus peraridilitoris (strain DSM 19664 / LMG 22246 / CIP 109416 / KR-200) TaxID=937777 RepID=L0A6I9_DEIPD|nr:enolase C-terminal domain-like protein [Deinococcus peraridilitoris]AFZ68802.1 enolase superfamily enzyme related to L-alanine-DL-glutamate epimerase [Deinococcus peraridilitoris DSM 19664]
MTVIEQIEAIPYRLPLLGMLAWGKHSRLDAAEHVLVRVHVRGGAVGEAEAPPRPTIYGETVASIQAILGHLKEALIGLDIRDEEAIASVLGSVANNHTARGALDMACWDARAQVSGTTLFDRLLGPQRRLRVSYILGISDRQVMLDEARRVVEAGVRVLKVKVGRDHHKDLAVIGALAHEFEGAGVDLYADSNETLTPKLAREALRAMREAGLLYVEEPLPVRSLRARASLKKFGELPVIADDSCFSLPDLERELDFDTFDILNIKTARTGFTESLRMLALARRHGKGVMVGSQASTSLGTVHAALMSSQQGVTHPCELSFFLKLPEDIVGEHIVLHEGELWVDELRTIRVDAQRLHRWKI